MKKLLLVLSVVAMASFLFVGCLNGTVTPPVNNAPAITSTAVTSATVGEAYTYDVDATDPDEGDVLTYSLNAAPTGMAIVPTTGVISWTPAAAGTFSVSVSVSDGELSDTQSFDLTVSEAEVIPEVNHAPEITSTAVTSVTLPAVYTYTVEAIDEDGDALTYALITLTGFVPAGMTISSAGVVNWTPTVVGLYNVTVEVSDGELTDIQSFTVTVSPVPVGPTVVSLLPLEAIDGEAYAGQVTATAGDDATLTYSLVGAPGDMAISATGLITWTPAAAGDQVVTVVVTDGAALSDTEDFTIVVAARVAPDLVSIVNQIAYYGEVFTYTATATAGTSLDLTFSLTEKPVMMIIDPNTGIITWTPILAELGYHLVTVKVTADDGLFDDVSFIIEVRAPVVVPLTATIAYGADHSYIDSVTYVRGYSVFADCVPVTVTFSEAVEYGAQIRWNDGVDTGTWKDLTDSGDHTIFTGCLPFNGEWSDCKAVCVDVRLYEAVQICCPEYIGDPMPLGVVYVDSVDPCASFIVTIEDCPVGDCPPFEDPGAEMSWTTLCGEICEVDQDCCNDYCSGVGDWEFILDYDICGTCDTEPGNDCDITGAFECGCLLYAVSGEVEHVVDVSIKDNVGNEFTDTWTLTFDSQELISFAADGAIVTDMGDGEWNIDYECTWDDCDECFPPEIDGQITRKTS